MKSIDLINYLDNRNVNDKNFREFVLNNLQKKCEYKLCTVNGFDFMVDHFFDNSSIAGYDIILTNEILKTTNTNILAIGLIEGDDIICMDLSTGAIFLWMIQTGDGKFLEVSSSFQNFIKKCCDL